MAGRTTIVISHNLLTVTDADRILYLEDGRIAAAGTHTELLSASPGYARLYHLQGTTPALVEIEPATEPVPTVLALDPR
jgi:ABC-type multidrug transport system fused ATPase/permease subunit